METKAATSSEYDRFTNLVDQVMSVPKVQAQRIVKDNPAPVSTKRSPKRKDAKRTA